jgi:uncharacterized glyoxalase superfamily protein PhnB
VKNRVVKILSLALLCAGQASFAADIKTTLVINEQFEQSLASVNFDSVINPHINNYAPLSGVGSMSLGMSSWGALGNVYDPIWDSGLQANLIESTINIRIDSVVSSGELQFCTYVYFQVGQSEMSCDSRQVSENTLTTFTNTVRLDEEREIDRIFVRLKHAGDGFIELTADNLHVSVTESIPSESTDSAQNDQAVVVLEETFEQNFDQVYFDNFSDAVLSSTNPIDGVSSLSGVLNDWGSLASLFDPSWDSGTFADSVGASLIVKALDPISYGALEFCVYVYYQAQPSVSSCDTASQLNTEIKQFSVELEVDSNAEIDRIYVRLKNSGAGAVAMLLDNLVVNLTTTVNQTPVPDEQPTTPPEETPVPDGDNTPPLEGQIVFEKQFEQDISNFYFDNVNTPILNTNDPIYGNGSLSATINTWGAISSAFDPAWDSGIFASSINAQATLRIDEIASDGDLELCLFVYFQEGQSAEECEVKTLSIGLLPMFNLNIAVDDSMQLDRIYIRLKHRGNGSVSLNIDNVQIAMVGVLAPNPEPNDDPDPNTDPNPDSDPNMEPDPGTNPDSGSDPDPNADPESPVEPDPLPTLPPASLDGLKVYLNADVLEELRASMTSGDAAAIRFKSMVDYQLSTRSVYGFQEWNAALLYQVTNEAKYCNYAVAEVDSFVRSEEQLISSANGTPQMAHDSYLEAGAIIADIALVRDWCSDFLTTDMIERWSNYADSSVFNIWNPTLANWNGRPAPHNGWSIDNPFNNYYYSFLEATMLTALAFEDDNLVKGDWRRMFRVTKVGRQLIPALRDVLVGGGSREGTGYGTSLRSLYRLFDWWYQSTGEKLTDFTNHAKETSYYFLHALVPTKNYLVPFADQSRDSTAAFFDYHRQLLLETATLYKDENVAGVVKHQLENSSVTEMRYGFNYVYDFIYANQGVEDKQPSILNDSYYSNGTGALFSRSDWSESATQFSTTIGQLTESHDHHDKGAFNLYKTEWLAYDQVINSHSGLLNMEWAHNLVRIQDTATGDDYTTTWYAGAPDIFGLKNNRDWLWVAIDTKPVFDHYALEQPLSENRREMIFIKKGILVVLDKVVDNVNHNTRKIWQLNTPFLPTFNNGKYVMQGSSAALNLYPILPESVNAETTDYQGMDDMRGQYTDSAGELTNGYRLDLSSNVKVATFLNVLDTDNLVSEILHSETASSISLQINLYSGESYTIEFNTNSKGGSIQKNSDEKVDLSEGIESWLPENP